VRIIAASAKALEEKQLIKIVSIGNKLKACSGPGKASLGKLEKRARAV